MNKSAIRQGLADTRINWHKLVDEEEKAGESIHNSELSL